MIQERLEEYRRQKRKKAIRDWLAFRWNRVETEEFATKSPMDEKVKLCNESEENIKKTAAKITSSSAEDSSMTTEDVSSDEDTPVSGSRALIKFTYLLYALLWITLYVIALEYEFGAVYFVLSILVFICVNTRSGPKRRGEPSAYSVFNPNCEAIDGTLDASQFENEIRYGVGGVR
ncbi:hypothetical protein HN011_010702 [Eciton burchellii]|nr:hypothetical protein HN011_010702 [Eciton burchellii]